VREAPIRYEGMLGGRLNTRLDHLKVVDRGRAVEIPVITVDSGADGPVVVVTGNVHGDEPTGVYAAHRLLDRLPVDVVRGRVHVYPTLNPPGLRANQRGVGPEGPDLNRKFPGRRSGDLAARLARVLWDDLVKREPALLIDLHADSSQSIPYAIVDRAVRHRGEARRDLDATLCAYAEATGLTVIHEYPDELYLRFGLDRSLAGATVNDLGVPAVTIESGPRRVVSQRAIDVTVEAVRGVLAKVGVIDAVVAPDATRRAGGPWRRTSGPRTRFEGLFVPLLPPGAVFEAGALLGVVRAPDGQVLEEVHAVAEGLVVSWVDGAWLEAGTVVATLGVPEGA